MGILHYEQHWCCSMHTRRIMGEIHTATLLILYTRFVPDKYTNTWSVI